MKTLVTYAGMIAGLWTFASLTFVLGFVVGRGFRKPSRPIAPQEGAGARKQNDGKLTTRTQELIVAQFSKSAWLSRPLM